MSRTRLRTALFIGVVSDLTGTAQANPMKPMRVNALHDGDIDNPKR